MPLKVWDSSGHLVIDISTRLSKLLGSVAISAPGSITVTLPSGNQLWAMLLTNGTPSLIGNNFPSVAISGNTLTWSYTGATNRVTGTILYGAF